MINASLRMLERAASVLWHWRHAALLRRIDRGAVRTRLEYGWVQLSAAADGSPTVRARLWIFGRPQWQVDVGAAVAPVEGSVRGARIIFVESVAWPVLAHTDEGLILPRSRPRRIESGN